MGRVNIGAKSYIMPMPVLMLSAYGKNEKPCAMLAVWGGISNTNEITPKLIIDVISRYFNVSVDDIMSGKRNKEIAFPRQIAMYFCRILTDYSFPDIGEFFNGRDHSTIMHGVSKVADTASVDSDFRETLEELKNTIVSA